MTTPATDTTPPTDPASTPSGKPPRGGSSAERAAGASATAVELQRKAEAEAAEAAKIKAEADARAKKAKEEAEKKKDQAEDLKRLEHARRHLRAASPENPVPLRRVECMNAVGDTAYGGSPRQVIDKANTSLYRDISLLFDGQVVHVINAAEPGKSFWIGYANIAAMYPRFDI